MKVEKLSIEDLLYSPDKIESEFSGYPNYNVEEEEPARFYLAKELGLSPFDLRPTYSDSKIWGSETNDIYESPDGAVYQVLNDEDAMYLAVKSEKDLLENEGVKNFVTNDFYDFYIIEDKMFDTKWFNDWLDEYNASLAEDGEEPIETNDPIELFSDTFGEDELKNILEEHSLYNYDEIAETVIDLDGTGSVLANYDGKTLYLSHEYSAFRIE